MKTFSLLEIQHQGDKMRVELLNAEEVKNLFKTWGDFSRVCYNTGEKVASEKIGKHCFDAKHFSGSRSTYINFKISDVPRSTIDQLARKRYGYKCTFSKIL